MIAAVLVFSGVVVFEQDEVAVARAEAGHPISSEQIKRLERLVQQASTSANVDEEMLVHLRGAMLRLGRKADVHQLNEVIARITPSTLNGRIVKAMALQDLQRDEEADVLFQGLIDHLDDMYDNATRRNVLLAAARNAANMGHFATAVDRYARLESLGMSAVDVREEYAGVLARAGRADEAIKILEQGPPEPSALLLLASIYDSQKHFDKAIETYRRLLKIAPQNSEGRRGLADNALWSHDYSAAAAGYRKILTQTPDDLTVRTQLAAALLGGAHFSEAIADYAALLEQQPDRRDFIDGFLLAAAGAERLSADEQRILDSLYQRRSALDLDEPMSTHLLNALVRHGESQQVLPLLETLLAQAPQDFKLRLQLAGVLDQFHHPAEANRIFAELLGKLDKLPVAMRPQVLLASARNAANRGDDVAAAQRYDQLEALEPLDADLTAEYAGVLVQAGRTEDAVKLLEHAPPAPCTLRLLGSIYASQKRFDAAIDVYRRLLEIAPHDAVAERGIADNALWSRDFATAVSLYRKILERDPDDADVSQRLAEALLGGRNYQAALAAYTALIDREPQRPDLEDGFLLAASGAAHLDAHEARTLDALFNRPDRRTDEKFLTNLLNALSKHGRQQQVLPLLETLAKEDPENPALRLRLADALQNAGRFAEADENYRWLLAHPTSDGRLTQSDSTP